MSIMKYGISTIHTTQASDGKMPSFASKCIRIVVIARENGENQNKIYNYTIRTNNKIATIFSQKQREAGNAIYTDGGLRFRLHIRIP